jgi:hypothetical protein
MIAILMMAAYIGNTNVRVIHGEYNHAFTWKHHLNMYLHQFLGITMSLGILFENRKLVELHLVLLLVTIACFLWFKGCFLAIWERANIPYTPSDLIRIQRPPEKRFGEFFIYLLPLVAIDVYKLTLR